MTFTFHIKIFKVQNTDSSNQSQLRIKSIFRRKIVVPRDIISYPKSATMFFTRLNCYWSLTGLSSSKCRKNTSGQSLRLKKNAVRPLALRVNIEDSGIQLIDSIASYIQQLIFKPQILTSGCFAAPYRYKDG